ncbi:MAG TPA: hypothetical protein VEZ11_03925 [Thermoanaerobaculia bacterium]|nr:hypothetical protein [Thermoanaerobaculia bacterium]
MATTTAASALIHFIGLCVFTAQPNAPALTAGTNSPRAVFASDVRTAAQTAPAPDARRIVILPRVAHTNVEDHTALIAFRQSQLVFATGWKPAVLRRDKPAYNRDPLLYVPLHGERVRFVTNGFDGVTMMMRPLVLPSLKTLYNIENLKQEYSPPSFAAAAAVFDVPAAALSACAGGDGNRFDTELKLQSDGVLIVTSGTKTIVVRLRPGDATVIVANVPLSLAQGRFDTNASVHTMPHYSVYCAMGGVDQTTCLSKSFPEAESLSACPDTGFDPENSARAASFECSNSQWP